MNVTENYLLQQMQTLAAAMSNVPQTGTGKDKDGSTFQDLMNKAGKANESASAANSKDTGGKETVEEAEETAGLEKGPVKNEEEEELKPEQLVANPNAVIIMDLFRPDVVQPAEEPVIEVPVDAIAETSVEGPELALDGELPQMETGVEADVQPGVSMEQQQAESFQQALEEVPQERPAENTETVEAPVEAAPEQVEVTDKPQVEVPEEVEAVEIEAETDEDPKAEAAEVEQPVFHETQSAPVKVGETYETVDTEQPEMEQKLTDIIQTAVQNGAEKIEIRLAPQNLGSLTIEMTKDANGALQVVLHTSNAKAAGVLNQHMDGLQAALRNYSQEEVRIEVQRNDESQEQHFKHADPDGRGNQQRQQQQERREEKHTGDAFVQKLRLGLFGSNEI